MAPDCGRSGSLARALRLLHSFEPGPVTIVEIGTLRDDRPLARATDGWSTLAWAWFCRQAGGRVLTIDCDPEALAVCRRVTAEHSEAVTFVCEDSLSFLARAARAEGPPSGDPGLPRPGTVHLVYLDSLDYVDRERSEAHHLAEAEAALPLLAPRCLVLLDDTEPVPGGPPRREPPGPGAAGGEAVQEGAGAEGVPASERNGCSLSVE